MVLNSPLVVGVATASAELCQHIACNPERLSRDQVLYLLFSFPCRQLRRLCSAFCLPPPPLPSPSSSSDSDLLDLHPHIH
ncbi:unnamed protein product [Cuscuta campestris]|uniref:Uncharacterized protein n=1 Tax=Cuscuta campestris TaxID=132261 RepID=A0A484K8R6_9ASTE|nr:unnamed protein product [Cuscuta campestris]